MNKALNLIISVFVVMTLMSFVSCYKDTTPEQSPVATEVILKSSVSWNGDPVPNYAAGVPECTILKITVQPKARLNLHQHPMMNAAIIVQGELHVVDDEGREITVKAGDALLECVHRNHYGENLTNEEVVLYVFYAGVQGQELSLSADY